MNDDCEICDWLNGDEVQALLKKNHEEGNYWRLVDSSPESNADWVYEYVATGHRTPQKQLPWSPHYDAGVK